jgi:hypothetical protein
MNIQPGDRAADNHPLDFATHGKGTTPLARTDEFPGTRRVPCGKL